MRQRAWDPFDSAMTQSETVGCTVPGSNPEEASRETHKAHFRKGPAQNQGQFHTAHNINRQ